MGLAPLHNRLELIPVIHFLILQILYRRPGNDHAVELLILNLIKIDVKFV